MDIGIEARKDESISQINIKHDQPNEIKLVAGFAVTFAADETSHETMKQRVYQNIYLLLCKIFNTLRWFFARWP